MERPSSAHHHLDALTGVRAFAALWVFVFHSWSNAGSPAIHLAIRSQAIDLTPLVAFGWLGVDVFFVLSGFLLTRQAVLKLGRRSPAKTTSRFVSAFGEKYSVFLRRRILRVYPAYYACITALLILAATKVYGHLPGELDLLLHLGMVHNFIEKYIATMNGVFWTMPFEWQFYLVFPLLVIVLRRYGGWSLYAIAFLGVVASKLLVMYTNNGYAQVLLPIRLDAFVAGMCAGAYSVARPPTRASAATAFWVGLGILLATPWVFAGYNQVFHYYDLKGFLRAPWIQVGICLMLLGLTGDRHAGVHIFGNKIVVGLGLISYSIYLWHVPILELLPSFGLIPERTTNFEVSWPRIVATALPVVLLLSTLSYWFIERPFQASGKPAKSVAKRRVPLGKFALSHSLLTLVMWAIVLEGSLILLRG
jgi:peptidoglycan/LPS O-acetylase OafA/YrhL